MKCKRCKKGRLWHVINTSEGDWDDSITHRVYVCEKCGLASIIKIKGEKE